ncbi:MAG TPA: hypothetical protein O0X99_00315, partial [Methanocorpusculum sp.]|nr:hypothetical protein [Methanocorpusculum sp.]
MSNAIEMLKASLRYTYNRFCNRYVDFAIIWIISAVVLISDYKCYDLVVNNNFKSFFICIVLS